MLMPFPSPLVGGEDPQTGPYGRLGETKGEGASLVTLTPAFGGICNLALSRQGRGNHLSPLVAGQEHREKVKVI